MLKMKEGTNEKLNNVRIYNFNFISFTPFWLIITKYNHDIVG